MKTLQEKKIEKLEEALKIYSAMDFGCMCNECVKSRKVLTELTSELAALDKEIAEQITLQQFMDDVHKWADEIFGKERTTLAPLYHLKKEVDEAILAVKNESRDAVRIELADCFILILNATSKYGLTFENLFITAQNKMEANKKRQWGKPDKNGVVEHLKEDKEIEQGEEKMKKYLNKPLTEKERKIAHNTWLESQFEDTDKRKRAEEISYVICRNFVGEWLWNAPKYGDIRSSESFSLDQSRDAASMILRFIKQYASQSGYPEVTDKMIKTEMDNYFKKLQRNPLNDLERFRIEVAFEYAAKWTREQMKNR